MTNATDTDSVASVGLDEFTTPFVGRWTQLVSTTNWEKGRIIHEWRLALMAANVPATGYSDDAWSRHVGGVSPQHVGRLRRVHERFSDLRPQFDGLFWSHYQAALDWDDAEMWLEGAKLNDWSVMQMRKQRWESLGSPQDQLPDEKDIVSTEMDEDSEIGEEAEQLSPGAGESALNDVHESLSPAGPDFGDEDDVPSAASIEEPMAVDASAIDPSRPFESLPDLPDDMQEAFEAFKIAIVQHKSDNWSEVSLGSVVRTLDALKAFAASA